MLGRFLSLSFRSPTRRRALVGAALAHVFLLLLALGQCLLAPDGRNPEAVGNLLLVGGIVEGALLVGWRLTQIPKTQALEFVLVSPLESTRFLAYEAFVCVLRVTLVALSGLPVVWIIVGTGGAGLGECVAASLLAWTWALATGLGLAAWAYEPLEVRRWGERVAFAGVLVYLIVGVLAAENLPRWLVFFPPRLAEWLLASLWAMHEYNPFGAVRHAMLAGVEAWPRTLGVTLAGLALATLGFLRARSRLLAHFHDLHYRPVLLNDERPRPPVGAWPLRWWAVKRVGNYSGRINLWLASGFAVVYAIYLLAGPHWPAWLGRGVFATFDRWGGVPMLSAALVLLASVPAAFQYGLWDQDARDRRRRLELLLLTQLDGRAYWEAALAAAWNRGRGYFYLATLLWLAGWATGVYGSAEALAAFAAGVTLWGLHFALGFWAFSRGREASGLGIGLTLAVPIGAFVLHRLGWTASSEWLPPGSLYFANRPSATWALGPIVAGLAALAIARYALATCDASLRRWYAQASSD